MRWFISKWVHFFTTEVYSSELNWLLGVQSNNFQEFRDAFPKFLGFPKDESSFIQNDLVADVVGIEQTWFYPKHI